MSLSETQKVQVRKYLGYPSLYSNSFFILNTYLDDVTEEIQTEIESILAKIVTVETAILKALNTAGLQTVGTGDPGYYEGAKIVELRSIGRGYCAQLSQLLNLEIRNDPFGQGGAYSNIKKSFLG